MESLAIPTDATGQCAATGSRRRLLTELAFDTPVVREIQLPPLRIVQVYVLSTRYIAKVKAPVLIENYSFPRPRIGETKRCCTQEQTKCGDYVLFSVHSCLQRNQASLNLHNTPKALANFSPRLERSDNLG